MRNLIIKDIYRGVTAKQKEYIYLINVLILNEKLEQEVFHGEEKYEIQKK